MGERAIPKERLKELRRRYGDVPERELVEEWEIADPRLKAARKQHGSLDDRDIVLFGHRIRRMPGDSEQDLIVRTTNQHAGSLVRKVVEKVESANRIRSARRDSGREPPPHDPKQERHVGLTSATLAQHSSRVGPAPTESALAAAIENERRAVEDREVQEYRLRPIEAYALGRRVVVMVEERGVDFPFFYRALLEQQAESNNEEPIHSVGHHLRKMGIDPNVADETLQSWASQTSPVDACKIIMELQGLGINQMDLFLTGIKGGRLDLAHLIDENRKDVFKPLPAELVDTARRALSRSKARGGGESFHRLGPVIERAREDERNFDVARRFPYFKVTVKRVAGGDAEGKIHAIDRAVARFNQEVQMPNIELGVSHACALDDEFVMTPRTLAVSLRQLEFGGSMYSKYLGDQLEGEGITRQNISEFRELVDDRLRVRYKGESYRMEDDQIIFTQVSKGRLTLVPNIQLGERAD
ncbi:MAG: hypothetical protein GF416_07170 [Candidatus Altiarchaeales archaeon]|nr:hypothetical protein [Candidatus Altiarchaeales archaeon]MBD3416893.1 hypothetical protein [Candidatus Altiarchaeales archaeon]